MEKNMSVHISFILTRYIISVKIIEFIKTPFKNMYSKKEPLSGFFFCNQKKIMYNNRKGLMK